MLCDLEHIKEPNGRNRLYKEKVRNEFIKWLESQMSDVK